MARTLSLAIFGMLAFAPLAHAQSDWTTFTSKQFGLLIAYPDHLIDERNSDPARGHYALKGDALLILSKDELNGADLKRFLNGSLLKNIDVTYSQRKNNWMAYSGYAGDYVVYGRTHLSCGGRTAHSFLIRYPESARRTYDRIVERLSHSLKVAPAAAREC